MALTLTFGLMALFLTLGAPLELGVCVQRKRLSEPLIDAFWQLL